LLFLESDNKEESSEEEDSKGNGGSRALLTREGDSNIGRTCVGVVGLDSTFQVAVELVSTFLVETAAADGVEDPSASSILSASNDVVGFSAACTGEGAAEITRSTSVIVATASSIRTPRSTVGCVVAGNTSGRRSGTDSRV